jgi:hypothetical protein
MNWKDVEGSNYSSQKYKTSAKEEESFPSSAGNVWMLSTIVYKNIHKYALFFYMVILSII